MKLCSKYRHRGSERVNGEWCNRATRLVLAQKSPGSSPGSPAPPMRTAAAPPSYGGRPGSAPGIGSMCSYSNWQRGRLEEADVAGSTPAERTCLLDRRPSSPCKGRSPGSAPEKAPCLSRQRARVLGRNALPGSAPGKGSMRTWCSVVARRLPKPIRRVQIPSSAPCDRGVSG
jgi:hypothetical protein